MKDCFGQYGWKEFHRNRKNILDEYQRLIDLTSNRPVKVAHGQGVEAYIRKWLSDFLPKKYGVTSGYIIPNLYGEEHTIYHFDIIIYNQLEAPILWTEGNEDSSEQGKYRAIPAKHVVSVYEVKSRLNKKNVIESLEKLSQVNGFKEQLPDNYSSGVIFIELKEDENKSNAIVKALHAGKDVFGFVGGLILKYEGDESAIGQIVLHRLQDEGQADSEHLSPLAKKIEDLNIYQTEDGNLSLAEQGGGVRCVATSEKSWSISKMYGVGYQSDGFNIRLNWSRSNFSIFCVEILSRLDGLSYNDKRRPSFGMIFDSIRQQKAPMQPEDLRHGYPNLSIRLHNGGANGERHTLDFGKDEISIMFWVEVTNEGTAEANLSDDRFVSSLVLPATKKAVKPVSLIARPNEKGKSLQQLFDNEGLEIPYRIVYKAGVEGNELFSVEKFIRIKINDISISDTST